MVIYTLRDSEEMSVKIFQSPRITLRLLEDNRTTKKKKKQVYDEKNRKTDI